MIDVSLPPQPFHYSPNRGQTCEAFALCYLAAYSHLTLSARVRLSFTRAYGMQTLTTFPFVNAGKPGFLLTITSAGTTHRITIAIEGMRSWHQLAAWNALPIGGTNFSGGGYVFTPFLDYAASILAQLKTIPDFSGMYNNNDVPVLVTGFSLGAAVADVLVRLMQAEKPNRDYKCIKFASPRVGNYEYVRRRGGCLNQESYYCNADPIDMFPYTYTVPWPITPNAQQRWVHFRSDPTSVRLNMFGQPMAPALHEASAMEEVRYLRRALDNIEMNNPWFFHTMDAYRYMLTDSLPLFYTHELMRFLHVEFPDSNRWGPNWVRGEYIRNAMLGVSDPPPAEVETFFAPSEIEAINVLAGTRMPDTHPDSPGGGDYGLPPEDLQPVIPNVRQMQVVAPATFQPTASGRRRGR